MKRVVQTFENEADELVHVSVNGEEIITTPSHPFYVPKLGWTSAIKLRAGDILVLSNGEYVVVEAVQHEILESPVKVYNFEVKDFHTYFVGESSVLVHNDCEIDLPNRKQAFNQAKDLAGVPRSQQPVKQWVVGNDPTRKGMRNYRYSSDEASHGRFYQYDTPHGPRVIVEHTNDSIQGNHFHAGEPKEYLDLIYDFKKNRYKKIIDPTTGDHHIRYR